MAEEFVDEIISSSEESKTEAEMAAEIQGVDADKAAEIQKDVTEKTTTSALKTINATKDESSNIESTNGSAATPDIVQDDKVVAADSATIEELAAQIGWRKDHTGDDAVDAKTYILKSKDIQKSMGQHNKDLKGQLQGLSGSIEALKQHNESVYKSEVKRLTGEVTALKKERRAAIELADIGKVDELDEQIDAIQKDIDTPKPEDKKTQDVIENPAYDEWVKDNDWYLKDDEMAKYADTVADQYPGAPADRVYKLVRSKVQEVFPDKFESAKVVENKQAEVVKPIIGPKSPVESSSAKVSEGSFTKADLTQDQMQIMKQFVGGGIMTEEQYVNDIAKMQ